MISGSLGALALGALGIVYGDIGTSPLYYVAYHSQILSCQKGNEQLAVAQLVDLSGGNRQQMNSTTDKRPDDRAIYSDVLKVAPEDQFEAIRHGSRVPVPHDLGD